MEPMGPACRDFLVPAEEGGEDAVRIAMCGSAGRFCVACSDEPGPRSRRHLSAQLSPVFVPGSIFGYLGGSVLLLAEVTS